MEIALGIILNAYSDTYAILLMRVKGHTPGFELRFEIHGAGGIGLGPGPRGKMRAHPPLMLVNTNAGYANDRNANARDH